MNISQLSFVFIFLANIPVSAKETNTSSSMAQLVAAAPAAEAVVVKVPTPTAVSVSAGNEDPYQAFDRVSAMFAKTMTDAVAFKYKENDSLTKILEGADMQGRFCKVAVESRVPATFNGLPEYGLPEGSQILTVSVYFPQEKWPDSEGGDVIFRPGPMRDEVGRPANLFFIQPVSVKIAGKTIETAEKDGVSNERKTSLTFGLDGLLLEMRSTSSGKYGRRSSECLGLKVKTAARKP